jgi:23S rRNA (cytidine2498-2'-O)-methyltransferase
MTQVILTANADSDDLAMREVRQVDSAARLRAELAPGVLLVETVSSFGTLAAQWRTRPPIFVRHVCPVQVTLQLAGQEADLAALRQAVEAGLLAQIDPQRPFSVQTRILAENFPLKPFDLNTPLADLIREKTGAPLNVRAPAQVLSLVIARYDDSVKAFLGVSAVADNLSDWAGGVRRFARMDEQVSRSEFKLLEALEVFGIDLPVRGIALDLGAAPGGWTRTLRERGLYVTAIDPAELAPGLLNDKGIRYRRTTAENYLANAPDQFDVIVNDMRMDARAAARLMCAYARVLRPGGFVIMTLKLPEHEREPFIDHAFNILRMAYTIAGARQLFHNRSEITVYLQPR